MDIDIDIQKKTKPENYFPVIKASMVENGELRQHPVGYYFQFMPQDPVTKCAAIPYTEAFLEGYIKIDFLHLNILDNFQSKKEMKELLKQEPNWDLLKDDEIVSKLFHLSKHGEILKKLSPRSVSDLADVIALIRPNKIKLIDKYLENRENIRKILYVKTSASDMRKSHAVAYALLVKLQLLLFEQI